MMAERDPPDQEPFVEPEPDPAEPPHDDTDWPHDLPAEPLPEDPPTVLPGDSADERPDVVPNLPSGGVASEGHICSR